MLAFAQRPVAVRNELLEISIEAFTVDLTNEADVTVYFLVGDNARSLSILLQLQPWIALMW